MSISLIQGYNGVYETTCPPLTFCLKKANCWDYNYEYNYDYFQFQNNRDDDNYNYGNFGTDSAVTFTRSGGPAPRILDPTTAPCFQLMLGLMVGGVILVIAGEFQGRKKQFRDFSRVVQLARDKIEATLENLSLSFSRVSLNLDDLENDDRSDGNNSNDACDKREGNIDPDHAMKNKISDDIKELEMAFVTTFRTESNFVKNNTDPTMKIPKLYSAEYVPRGVDSTTLPITGFFSAEDLGFHCNLLISVWVGSIGWAMICSGFSSLLWILVDYETHCYNDDIIHVWIDDVGNSLTRVRNDYKFYPVFLLIGYLAYVVERWRDFMKNCHETQAKLHDVAMLCGGCVLGVPNADIRRRLFRIYRYINLIHALCFHHVSPTLKTLDVEYDFVRTLRLLECDEADEIANMGNKKRDAVIGWLAGDIAELTRLPGVNGRFVADTLARALAEVRALTARHHDLFVRDNPNFYLDLMILVVNTLLFLVVISYPFSLLVYSNKMLKLLPCFQPIVMIAVFAMVASFRTAYSLLARLRNPFSWSRDRISIDSLLASTDRTIFVSLRANFRGSDRQTIEDKNKDRKRRHLKSQVVERKALEKRQAEEEERRKKPNRVSDFDSQFGIDENGRFQAY